MALTRLRTVAGNETLARRMEEIACDAIINGKPDEERKADILDMRQRLWREKPPRGEWDIKLTEGGLVDLEFVLQQGMLLSRNPDIIRANTGEAIETLRGDGFLSEDEAQSLDHAFRLLQSLQQVQRVAVGSEVSSEDFSRALKERLALAADCPGFQVLEHRYSEVRRAVADIRCKKIGPLATES